VFAKAFECTFRNRVACEPIKNNASTEAVSLNDQSRSNQPVVQP
jgi:hypothetical protein